MQQDHFPILRSILSPEALVPLLQQAYGLAVSRLQLIKAAILDTYRVESGDGATIFRIYPAQRRTFEEIRAELDFLEFLHGRGIPVSVPLATESGARTVTLQAPEGARHAAMFTYAPGREPAGDPHVIRRYGETLARLHAVARSFESGARTPLDLRFLLDRPLARLQVVPERRETWLTLREIAGTIRPHLEALPATAPAFGFCHGDVCKANARVNGAGDVTLFDFDFCGPGWRAYDVASFLSGEPAAAKAAFLDGYQSVQTLTEQEVEVIPLFQVAQRIWMLGMRASYLDEWGTMRLTDDFVDHVLGQIRATLDSRGLDAI
jgi:Ser/Thr protein kinase RdoA (MazF antagonist)